MEINRLRSIIRESINNNLKEIEDVAENAAMEAKLNAYTEAIDKVNKKIEMAESLEEMKELVDPTKLNELKKHLKTLEKSKEKLEKVKAKKNKGKEVVTDEPVEDTVDEGSYYDEAESDDAAHIDALEKDMEDDAMNNEVALNESFLKMQKLAGVITESQYNEKKRLIENEVTNNPVVQKLEKKAFDFFNQPQVTTILKKELNKLSPEKKAELAKTVMQEGEGNDFNSFKATVDKVMDDASLTEDLHDFLRQKVGGYKKGEAPDDLDYVVGKVLKTTGAINLMSMGFLPMLTAMAIDTFGGTDIVNTVAQAIGDGQVTGALSIIAGLIGGGILWKIGDILTDEKSDYIVEESENQQKELTPKEVAQIAVQNINKLKSDPKLKAIADKIAADPKATEELNKILAKFNISLSEGDIDVSPQDVYKIALTFAKKADTLNEEADYGWTIPVGFFGGGTLAHYIASLGDVITPYMKSMGYAPSHMTAGVIGGLSAAALLMIGQYIYDNYKK